MLQPLTSQRQEPKIQPIRYTAYVMSRDGIARRLTLLAKDLADARHAVHCAAVARFPGQPLTFSVRLS